MQRSPDVAVNGRFPLRAALGYATPCTPHSTTAGTKQRPLPRRIGPWSRKVSGYWNTVAALVRRPGARQPSRDDAGWREGGAVIAGKAYACKPSARPSKPPARWRSPATGDARDLSPRQDLYRERNPISGPVCPGTAQRGS